MKMSNSIVDAIANEVTSVASNSLPSAFEENTKDQDFSENFTSTTGKEDTESSLFTTLRKQLEYYFSIENLAQDSFLVSQMSSDFYVPISIIAQFKMVRSLSQDINLITEALRSSSAVQVDETGFKVRPNISLQRNTIILRDIPSSTDPQDVASIFAAPECPAAPA
eukprot:Sdes_comp9836_c0_seq1m1377